MKGIGWKLPQTCYLPSPSLPPFNYGSDILLCFRESSEASKPIKQQIKLLKQQEMDDYLALLENTSDFINAINWLPAGYLWAETMSSSTSGFFGVISTLVKLYRMHSWRRSWCWRGSYTTQNIQGNSVFNVQKSVYTRGYQKVLSLRHFPHSDSTMLHT